MELTDQDLELIRRSLDRLKALAAGRDPFGTVFYERLFARLPQARPLFRDDLPEQGMRFLSTLSVIVDALDREGELEEHLVRLAQGHAAYGVRPEYYAPMGEALMETMRAILGEKFDPATEAAWTRAYAAMADRMALAAAAREQL